MTNGAVRGTQYSSNSGAPTCEPLESRTLLATTFQMIDMGPVTGPTDRAVAVGFDNPDRVLVATTTQLRAWDIDKQKVYRTPFRASDPTRVEVQGLIGRTALGAYWTAQSSQKIPAIFTFKAHRGYRAPQALPYFSLPAQVSAINRNSFMSGWYAGGGFIIGLQKSSRKFTVADVRNRVGTLALLDSPDVNNSGQFLATTSHPGTRNPAARSFILKQHYTISAGAIRYWTDSLELTAPAGGSESLATDLNDHGQAAGSFLDAHQREHAAVWTTSRRGVSVIALRTLGGASARARSMNNLGSVVGYSKVAGGASHAFLWKSGKLIDLNNAATNRAGLTIFSARAIDDSGRIAADAIDASGQRHVVLLLPSGSSTAQGTAPRAAAPATATAPAAVFSRKALWEEDGSFG